MGNNLTCCVNPAPHSACRLLLCKSLDEVSSALRELLGNETVTLIFGIGFVRKPGWRAGEKDLHQIGDERNNYEKVITIIGKTVNNINLHHRPIYVFGFAEASTPNRNIFKWETEPCDGYEEAISQYRNLAVYARPQDSVSYGPIIRKAVHIASKNRAKHHVLVIVTSETVTRNGDVEHNKLSEEEKDTYTAIEEARKFRLSIVLVGIGETNANMKKGLWISRCCRPNNFKFVDYTKISSTPSPVDGRDQETEFCLAVTLDLPGQIALSHSLSSNVTAADVDSANILP